MRFACSKTRRLMTEYADGRLSGSVRGTFESHLDSCPGCRKEYEGLREVRALLASAPRFSAPAALSSRVMGGLEAGRFQERRRSLPRVMLLRTIEAALILLVVAAGMASGNFLAAGLFPGGEDTGAAAGRSGASVPYSVEAFDPAPPGSVGAPFVIAEERNEK